MVKAEVVAIGDEVLRGLTVNTNASVVSQSLFNVGYEVHHHSVIPDAKAELKAGLQAALDRSDIVVACGGLGPTLDDHTREALATLFSVEMIYHSDVAAEIEARFGRKLKSTQHQATLPRCDHLFPNPVGTAYGMAFHREGRILIALPGVPSELLPMMEEGVIPYLLKHLSPALNEEREILHFAKLVESEVDPFLRELEEPGLKIGIYPGYGFLSVHLATQKGRSTLEAPVAALKERFGHHYFEERSIDEALHHALLRSRKTLATAESCTGGTLASRLVHFSGASDYLLGGLVAYSNKAKSSLLGVSEDDLKQYGAVSPQVVKQMAIGACDVFSSEIAMATSGVAGPSGGSQDKPVGTVDFAIATKGQEPIVWRGHFPGPRDVVIRRAGGHIFSELYLLLKEA